MGELAADAEEVVLLLELEDTCLQIVWDVLSHLLALHTAVKPALEARLWNIARMSAHVGQPTLTMVSETKAYSGTARFVGAGPFRMRPEVS